MSTDTLHWSPVAHVEKFDAEQTQWVQQRTGLVAPQHADFIRLGPTCTAPTPAPSPTRAASSSGSRPPEAP